MSLLGDVAKDVQGALETIEGLGIYKSLLYVLTRTWEERIGRGEPVDSLEKVEPNPFLSDMSHKMNIKQGGSIKQGDIFIKYLPKSLFPTEDSVNLKTGNKLVEKFYVLDNETYEVISVVKGYAYWNLQIRKTSKVKL